MEIDRKGHIPILVGQREQIAAPVDPRIVDEDVDPTLQGENLAFSS
ncbi:hypothetical protein ABID26_007327 [Mesorhizobium shonense]|uniref:Uncharacterized protein n=1 Tax=Mesorhizobium shonense TaxID=1209948 RepID=A0ABV2I4R0_9HYPH